MMKYNLKKALDKICGGKKALNKLNGWHKLADLPNGATLCKEHKRGLVGQFFLN